MRRIAVGGRIVPLPRLPSPPPVFSTEHPADPIAQANTFTAAMTQPTFSDLLHTDPAGRPVLLPGVHPLSDLLQRDADGVLAAFLASQREDFRRVIAELEDPQHELHAQLAALRAQADAEGRPEFGRTLLFQTGGLGELFEDLHEHVMGHPVWRHPFFVRFFAGDFDRAQMVRAVDRHTEPAFEHLCVRAEQDCHRFHRLEGPIRS